MTDFGRTTQAQSSAFPTVALINAQAGSSIVLVCEHASNHIPAEFQALGLPPDVCKSHIAWDPGAFAVAQHMSRLLDAKLVVSTVSRLVYDCNRPPEAPDAMPAKSEIFDIPGNADMSAADRAARAAAYYTPFRDLLADTIANTQKAAIVTVHSFTPVYHGKTRAVEIGILHDSDTRLADGMLRAAPDHTRQNVQRNEPYGPEHGVTHTLKVHGLGNGLLNVMLEIRNDLISTASEQESMAGMLAGLISEALPAAQHRQTRDENA